MSTAENNPPRIRVVTGKGSVMVEADDDVTADEVIAFLRLEHPRLAQQLQRTADIVRRVDEPGISDEAFWQRTL